ncbi:hypothetical protein [Mycobacteroides abscessus]|uniref:hypothetical protein n=1 Tax=Mycobacteroides abscessus TaxID=36809 RepID=UPI0009A5F447|nr:hypothetical protein [Mycobacteroides abscessus]SKT22780.1 Uncharacterised protein [Mycobacteroides abscessus subsp. bolletii]SLF56190.1 Uncharacterised protein [Mycobacteroides abscessus subsp. bolletii]
MRFWPRKDPEPTNDDYFAMRRRQDPDYDEKRRVHLENVRLRDRRDFLRQHEENKELQREIAELEARRRA